MKTTLTLLALAALSAAPEVLAQSHGNPFRPVGSLDVSQKLVRKGRHSDLAWDITYPKSIPDVLIAGPTGTVTTREEIRLQIRVAGVAFQSGSTLLPVGFWTKIGTGTWKQKFYGTSTSVQPNLYVVDQIVPANTTIDFSGRGRASNGTWYSLRTTTTTDLAVIGLKNGDTPPSYAPAYAQGDIESFLTGLIDEDENRVTIGPLDMIYLFELASRDPGDWYFDMQDLVVVATFTPTGN